MCVMSVAEHLVTGRDLSVISYSLLGMFTMCDLLLISVLLLCHSVTFLFNL